MSDAAFDPEEYAFPEDGSNAPRWLSRFVRDQVRPLLVQYRQTAQEALDRWLACQDERGREQQEWDARVSAYERDLATAPAPEDLVRLTDDGNPHEPADPEPPGEGYAWGEPLVLLDNRSMVRVKGWMPLELRMDNGPPTEYPLPPPSDRDLSPDECWVALVAAHDVCRVRREQIVRADSIPFAVLCRRALELTEAQLPDLQAILATASASLASAMAQTPTRPAALAPATEASLSVPPTPAPTVGEVLPSHRGGQARETCIDTGQVGTGRAVGDEGSSTPLSSIDPHRPPSTPEESAQPERQSAASLMATERAVLAILKRQRKGRGIQGKAIIAALKKKGIDLQETTLRRHILPKLRQFHGVENVRSAGGYLIPIPEAGVPPTP
jgi:hypothetical protein